MISIYKVSMVKQITKLNNQIYVQTHNLAQPSGASVINLFSSSTQLSMKFIMLINVKMPTIVGILTFISIINTKSELKSKSF